MHWLCWRIKIILLWAVLLLTDAEDLICFDILQEAQETNGSPLDTIIWKIQGIFSHVLLFTPLIQLWCPDFWIHSAAPVVRMKPNLRKCSIDLFWNPLRLIHSLFSCPSCVCPSFSPSLSPSVVCRPGLTKALQYWRSHLLPPFGPHVWEGGGGTVHCAWPAYVHVFCFVCPLAGALHAERPWYSHILSPPSSHVWEGYTGMWRRNAQNESVVEKSWSKFKLFKLYLMLSLFGGVHMLWF